MGAYSVVLELLQIPFEKVRGEESEGESGALARNNLRKIQE